MSRSLHNFHYRIFAGLPPDGEPGIFIGWDAEHNPHILTWKTYVDRKNSNGWYAVGFQANEQNELLPTATRCIEDKTNFIVAWAHSPMCPPITSPEDRVVTLLTTFPEGGIDTHGH